MAKKAFDMNEKLKSLIVVILQELSLMWQWQRWRFVILGATFIIGLVVGFLVLGCGAHYRQTKCDDAYDHLLEMGCKLPTSPGPDWIPGTDDDATWLSECYRLQTDAILRFDTAKVMNAETCEEAGAKK